MELRDKVLVVEDDERIRRSVRQSLEAEGFQVFEAPNGERAQIEAGTRKPGLIILDLGLPDRDGIAVIRGVRVWSSLPILVLSARTDEHDKVTALNAGADDYLTKPFGVAELLARVRAVLRRHGPSGGTPIQRFGDVTVDFTQHKVSKAGQGVHLTPLEFRLLSALMANPGKVLTHRHLLNTVWGPTYVEHDHYVRIYMGHLRQKLEDDAARPRHLLTEIGVGYRFIPD